MRLWYALSIEETEKVLEEGPKNYGPNRLEGEDSIRWPMLLARQFGNLLVLILAVAAILSFFVGDEIDALAIVIIIILNALLGFVQEWKAETALKNLKNILSPRCRVLRNGHEEEIESEKLIPGDRVLLRAGNAVPADLRLVQVTNLKADESALTGESIAANKHTDALPENASLTDRHNMVWMGTHIVNGHGEGLVVATGMDTEFGRIAGLTGAIAETQTRLQKHLNILARQLGVLALVLSFAVVMIGVLGGRDLAQVLMTGISLAVAAVPEGLPAVVTITLALGMSAMARKKALLRHMQAAETLGAVSVICTDKTGTLTKNEMTVQKIWIAGGEIDVGGAGYVPEGSFSKGGHDFEPQLYSDLMALLDTGRKCNHARIEEDDKGWKIIGSPTEAALIVVAEKAGLKQNHGTCIVTEHSFNSDRKRMSVIEEAADGMIVHVKGAPEVLLPLSRYFMVEGEKVELTDSMREDIRRAYEGMAKGGVRTLALARRSISSPLRDIEEEEAESDLVFLGVVGVSDPPRPEVREALRQAQQAGIRVILITGDSPDTALAVSRQIGLKAVRAVTGSDIKALTDDALFELLKEDILFARTVPEDKFRLVKLLQAQGQLVAMTGDGVNDAPALKQADIGVAMGIRGTDVAKGAADIVLMDDNFATIIAAVAEGRRQYANIRKFVYLLTSHSIGEVSAVFFNILLGGPLILLPIQILWINLATDGVTALALSVEKAEVTVMDEPPRLANQPLLSKNIMVILGLAGFYVGISSLILFEIYLDQSYALASTVAFTNIVMTAQVLALSFRSLQGPLTSIGWFSNPWILTAIFAMTMMQAAAIYTPFLQNILHTVPLSVQEWGVIVIVILPLLIIPEIYKGVKRNRK
ncbi:MAG: cation-translocating P-type ATPase [Micavibrio sp.]